MPVQQYDPGTHGVSGRTKGSAHLKQQWELADASPQPGKAWVTHPLTGQPMERVPKLVPWESIWIDDSISPRDFGNVDEAYVERYEASIDATPPLAVQTDTFRLIGGRHRLEAHIKAGHDLVPVVEWDIADVELEDAAFLDNVRHGRDLTPHERREAGKKFLKRHHDLPDTQIAATVGVHRNTVREWRQSAERPKQAPGLAVAERGNWPTRVPDNPFQQPVVPSEAGQVIHSTEIGKRTAYEQLVSILTLVMSGDVDKAVSICSIEELEHITGLLEQVESWAANFCAKALAKIQRGS